MTKKAQGGEGATPERIAKGNIKTRETMQAGEIAQKELWPDIVSFLVEQAMINADHEYGWTDYCRIRAGAYGTDMRGGSSSEGWSYQLWIRFGQIVGHARMNWLNELWDYPVPPDRAEQIAFTRWRLNRCTDKIRDALIAAGKAAQEAREEMEAIRGR